MLYKEKYSFLQGACRARFKKHFLTIKSKNAGKGCIVRKIRGRETQKKEAKTYLNTLGEKNDHADDLWKLHHIMDVRTSVH